MKIISNTRSIDYLTERQKTAIALRYWQLAIAELPCTAERSLITDRAIALGKVFKLKESDFVGLGNLLKTGTP